jgi:uncharacterized protein YukE
MADWKTDTELYDIAERLGNKIISMYNVDGVYIPNDGPRQSVVESIRMDADIFTSMDPRKIMDEFERMQRAAKDVGEDAVAQGLLQSANNKLTTIWRGEAAEAFGHQMTYIETFMRQQDKQLTFAAHSMGTAYTLAVHARSSFYELADATIAKCEQEIKETMERDNKAALAILTEIVKACITGFSQPESAGELVRWGLESFIDISKETQNVLIDGSKAEEVVASYIRARDNLKNSYTEGLNILGKWLSVQDSSLSQEKIPLLEPMPACTDVRSPDFSYGKFFDKERDPATFGGNVDQERQKMLDQQNQPAGLIGRRLDGEQP